MNEIFKDIPGWEGKYQASNLGRIKSKVRNEKILKPRKWKEYEKLCLYRNGERMFYQVHRLVWETFNGPIPEWLEIDHIDGDPSNNNLSNLRAVSHITNMFNPVTQERMSTGRKKRAVTLRDKLLKKAHELGFTSVEDYQKAQQRERQRERRRKKREEAFQEKLKKIGLTEEEYFKMIEEEHKEKRKEQRRKYYETHKKKMYEAKVKWKLTHLEEVREYHKKYWEENKHKYRRFS